jgi:AAA domain
MRDCRGGGAAWLLDEPDTDGGGGRAIAPCPACGKCRRPGYSIDDRLTMRTVFGASRARDPDDKSAIIAVQNFNGGVGNSTVTTPLVHYFALQGNKVLVVDCDSQATATTLFGFNPHFNIRRGETLYPYLSIDLTKADLFYTVKTTPWYTVYLIPSNLELFDVEYEPAASSADGTSVLATRFRKFKQGLADLAWNYDIVLLASQSRRLCYVALCFTRPSGQQRCRGSNRNWMKVGGHVNSSRTYFGGEKSEKGEGRASSLTRHHHRLKTGPRIVKGLGRSSF